MAWYLNNALTTMRAEVDARWPNRDKASDGTIGDEAHQASDSDHNPDADNSVDAWDMDINLYGPSGGKPSSDLEFLKDRFEAHQSSQYWIHDRTIASRDDGWKRWDYYGDNPHDKHIHWNTRSKYEDSTAPWGIEDEMTRDEFIANFRACMDDQAARDKFERNTVTYPLDSGYNTLSLFYDLRDALEALQVLTSGLYDVMQAERPELPPPHPRRPPQGEVNGDGDGGECDPAARAGRRPSPDG